MQWSDIREHADRPLSLAFSGTVGIDILGDPSSASAGTLALAAIEAEIEAFCSQVCREFAGARDLFARSTAPTSRTDQLLPWLPLRQGRQDPFAFYLREPRLSERFALNRPLVGQEFVDSVEVAGFQPSAYQNVAADPILFLVETVRLEDGSLLATITGVIKFTTAALALALAAFATPYGQQQFNDYTFSSQIQRTVHGQQCDATANWQVELRALQQLGMRDLNYAEPGIPNEVHALRVCNVQLALALAQGSPRLIDGLPHQATRAALSLYSTSKGLPQNLSITDDGLRGLLLEELQHRRR